MKFGPIPLDHAEGAILAHSLRLSGLAFKKGRLLSAEDVAALRRANVPEVIAARLEEGDMKEDEAAGTIAAAAAGSGIEATAPFTGRANLYAMTAGVLLLDPERVDRLNALDESITIATLRRHERVRPRQMVATVKIIPFAAPAVKVTEAAAVASEGGPLLEIAPFRPKMVGLVSTRLPGMKETILDKTRDSVRARIEALGSRLVLERRCAHEEAAVAAELRALSEAGCELLLVFGASAIVDRRDVIPAGITAAGGEVRHYGMPVDPGNLLLLARLGQAPVVGLPGCARSPKLNGFDWVLERLLADLDVGPREIQAMGHGGLLMEIETRPQPRAGQAGETVSAPMAPRIAALVLAAGQSRRMNGPNKLLAEIEGRPMLRHVVETALGSQARPVVVVTGHERARVEAALAGLDVRLIHNPDYASGLSTSLRSSLDALPAEIDGALICLGDMPALTPAHLNRLIAAFNPLEGRAICVPTLRGKRGNPVLFAARFFPEMREIAGDVGARHLIGLHADEVCEVDMAGLDAAAGAIFLDLDTPERLRAFRDGTAEAEHQA